jgi:methylase of polypeptide subunit release factors
VIQLATENGDLGSGKSCLDLGFGMGMLLIGATFVSKVVILVDCNPEALAVAQEC